MYKSLICFAGHSNEQQTRAQKRVAQQLHTQQLHTKTSKQAADECERMPNIHVHVSQENLQMLQKRHTMTSNLQKRMYKGEFFRLNGFCTLV